MLFAKTIVLALSLCSINENAIAMILIKGRAIIKPASWGFFNESQLAKDIIRLEAIILIIKIITL